MSNDRKKKSKDDRGTPRGPLGDARPDSGEDASPTPGGQPPEKVSDRPVVGTVKPGDYPTQQ